jgi:hypothetical protein
MENNSVNVIGLWDLTPISKFHSFTYLKNTADKFTATRTSKNDNI